MYLVRQKTREVENQLNEVSIKKNGQFQLLLLWNKISKNFKFNFRFLHKKSRIKKHALYEGVEKKIEVIFT